MPVIEGLDPAMVSLTAREAQLVELASRTLERGDRGPARGVRAHR